MIFLFTKSEKVGSRLIRWGLDTDVSHMAILFGTTIRKSSVIIESRLGEGVAPDFLYNFLKRNEVVTAVRPSSPGDWKSELDLRDKLTEKIVGLDYDQKGVSYLALSTLWYRKLLGRDEIPGRNIWADRQDFFCSETLTACQGELERHGVDFSGVDKQMITPPRARDMLLAAPGMVSYPFLVDFTA